MAAPSPLMRYLLDERVIIMTTEEIAEILAKPYSQQLLNGPEPARMAYDGLDGDPPGSSRSDSGSRATGW